MPFVVAAVHASAGKVDDDVRAVDLAGPKAERPAIPEGGMSLDVAAEDDHMVAAVLKRRRQGSSQMSCAACDHDFHNSSELERVQVAR